MKIYGPKKAGGRGRAKAKDGARILGVGASGPSRYGDGRTAADGEVSISLRWDEREERALELQFSADEAENLARSLWARARVARGGPARGSELDGSRTWREVGAELRRALEIYRGPEGELEALLHLRAVVFEAVEEALDGALEDEAITGRGVHDPTREGLLGFLGRDPDAGEEPDPE